MTDRNGFLGQRGAIELLERMRRNGRVPHGLLFQGPDGVGKASVALAFAADLLCEAGSEAGACGSCPSCRLVESGNHPDLLVVGRLAKKPSASGAADGGADPDDLRSFVVVDQIRELTRLAALTPRRGVRRVFVIDPADRMNAESQNALLKTLEEPPGAAVLILVASRPHLLLPTVRSRCTVVGFAALRVGELASFLVERGFAPGEAMTRAALAEGRPGRALALELEHQQEIRERVIAGLESLVGPRARLADLPRLAAELAGKTEAHLAEHLDMVEVLLRDAARAALRDDDPALVHADLAPRLARLGRSLDPLRAARLLTGIERLRGSLRLNLNRTLVAESVLAALAGGPIP